MQVCFVTSSDLEHKPDIVWPHSEQIIISAVSECGSFMAMGLKTGTVVVWDVYRGETSHYYKFTCCQIMDTVVLHTNKSTLLHFLTQTRQGILHKNFQWKEILVISPS